MTKRQQTSTARWGAGLLALVVSTGMACDQGTESESMLRDGTALPLQQPTPGVRVPAPLPAAHCEVQVEGQGLIDLETDYLPHVITCENGGANLEALKAQAISARSVAYYNMETDGSICDSQGCQVYTCGNDPLPIAYQAVEETAGQYLMFNGTLTYGFYVAGDNNTDPPSCVGVSGSTEHWVTYNEGRTGTEVEQTELGFVHDPGDGAYGQNRGCMSQWGARCLENSNGYDYLDILRFYYGDDIELVQAEGECIEPLDPGTTGEPPGSDDTAGEADDGGTFDDDGGDGDVSGGGDEGGSAGGDDGDPLPPGGTDGPSDDPTSGGGPGGPALPTTFGESDEEAGCACRSNSTRPSWLGGGLMLLGLGLLRRRRD